MASRSPSPAPSRPTNPLSRTPETTTTIRRSGSFNFSKPSIPSEPPQRTSLRASFEQKENERDNSNYVKTPRAKSPAPPSSKGAKSFMAPTISASSKAIAASPRRKILTERNETISVSNSLELPSRGEGLVKAEMGFSQIDPEIAKIGSFSSEEVNSDMGSGFHANPLFTPSPILSPLDADPSALPYDPKTNYLSPRPRFLHYRPKPRLEQYNDKEEEAIHVEEGKQLEDSFTSESSEEVTESTEGSHSQHLEKEPEEESCFVEEEAEKFEGQIPVPEADIRLNPTGNHVKTRFFTWYKSLSLLLVLVIACLYSPLLDSPALSYSSSTILRNYNGLATKFRDWASPLKVLGPIGLVNLTFSSVDQTVDYDFIFSTPILDQAPEKVEIEQAIEENMVERESPLWHEAGRDENMVERETPMEVSGGVDENHEEWETLNVVNEDVQEEFLPAENEENSVKELEEFKQEMSPSSHGETENVEEEIRDEHNEAEIENKEACVEEFEQERTPSNIEEEIKEGDNEAKMGNEEAPVEEFEEERTPSNIEEEIREEYNEAEIENKEAPVKELEQERSPSIHEEHKDTSHGLVIQSAGSGDNLLSSHGDNQITNALESLEIPVGSILGLSLAVLTLATTSIAFLCMKQKKSRVVAHKGGFTSKKVVASVSGSNENYYIAKGPYQNVVDMMGDSGPSEMSSSLHSSPYSGQQTMNYDRRMRRDSEASSSVSYGSFTTYERISAKKGYRDEDAVTPVRRSSRIKNQVASP